jgi:hypothetical protein
MQVITNAHDEHALPRLGHAVPSSVQNCAPHTIAPLLCVEAHLLCDVRASHVEDPNHVLEEKRPWLRPLQDIDVAPVQLIARICSKGAPFERERVQLAPADAREALAGRPSCEEMDFWIARARNGVEHLSLCQARDIAQRRTEPA